MELFSTTHHCPDHFSILALFDSAVERRVMRSWKRPRFIRIRQVERSGEVRLRKVRCAVCLRKSLSPSSLAFRMLDSKRRVFTRVTSPLSPPPRSPSNPSVQYFQTAREPSLATTNAIDRFRWPWSKEKHRADTCTGIVILRKAGNCIIVSTTWLSGRNV